MSFPAAVENHTALHPADHAGDDPFARHLDLELPRHHLRDDKRRTSRIYAYFRHVHDREGHFRTGLRPGIGYWCHHRADFAAVHGVLRQGDTSGEGR